MDYFWTSASKKPTIEKAFLELRAKTPLEKIKIKDLCALACVNKSTFYAHYEDIYALSDQLEKKLIEDILSSVLAVKLTVAQTETLTRDLFRAFVQNRQAVNILFSGSRQGIFANCIEKGLRRTRPLPPTPSGASCFPSACRGVSTPLPTTAARWTKNTSSIFWPRLRKRPRESPYNTKGASGSRRKLLLLGRRSHTRSAVVCQHTGGGVVDVAAGPCLVGHPEIDDGSALIVIIFLENFAVE